MSQSGTTTSTDANAVTGGGSSTDNELVRFNGTDGKVIQGSSVLLDDSKAMTALGSIALDSGATIDEFSTDGTLAGNSDTALPTEKAVKTYVDSLPVASMPDFVKEWHMGQLEAQETNFAPLEKITTTNIIQNVRSHDYLTIEYSNGTFQVPPDADTSGTVTFTLFWFARTAPAGDENVVWQFEHAAVDDEEDLDGFSYTAEVASPAATTTTQNALIKTTWTETFANLGWAVGDLVYLRVSRKATDALDTFDTRADTNDDALARNFSLTINQA